VTFFQIASSNISVGVKRAHGANHSIQQSSPQATFNFSEWHYLTFIAFRHFAIIAFLLGSTNITRSDKIVTRY
jgi:hypothetical protein